MKIPKQITHTLLASVALAGLFVVLWQSFGTNSSLPDNAPQISNQKGEQAVKITAVNNDGSLELKGIGKTIKIDSPKFTNLNTKQIKNWRNFATGRYILMSRIKDNTVTLPLDIYAGFCFKDPKINPKECPIKMEP